jgi:hypothetical protein
MPEAALQTQDPPIADPKARLPWFAVAAGWALALAGAAATLVAIPTTPHLPLRTLLAVSVCASGVGVLARRSWAVRPMLVIAILLIGAGVAYLALGGTSSIAFVGWCAPGIFLAWVAVQLHIDAPRSVQA